MISTSNWVFFRDERSASGFVSRNRASTDALSALYRWQVLAENRSFEVTLDDDLKIEASLTANIQDKSAGSQLDALCSEMGIKRDQMTNC